MNEIPRPDVLDPERVLSHHRDSMGGSDDRSDSERAHDGLRATCEYANRLWDTLAEVREQLDTTLTRDRAPESLAELYARVTSILAGSHGDSGFGRVQAARLSRP